jgi:hypothetical protein
MQDVIHASETVSDALFSASTLFGSRPGHQMVLICEEVVPSTSFLALISKVRIVEEKCSIVTIKDGYGVHQVDCIRRKTRVRELEDST